MIFHGRITLFFSYSPILIPAACDVIGLRWCLLEFFLCTDFRRTRRRIEEADSLTHGYIGAGGGRTRSQKQV